MPQPGLSQVHIDAPLTNISLAYLQDQTHFIATQVFPVVPVEKKSNKYFVYRKNDWFRDEAQRRADATESAGSGYNLDTDNYVAEVFAFHKDVGDQIMANADAPIQPLSEAAQFVTQRLLLRRELQFVTDYFGTGIWGTDLTGVAGAPGGGQFRKWSDYVLSDPFTDVEAGKEAVLSTTGLLPNTLVLGYKVFRYLKNHPDIIDRLKYTSRDNVTTDILARLFDVDRVVVATAIKATNNEGATAAYSFAYGDNALLCYVAPNPGLLTPSAGYTFAWTGVADGLTGATLGMSQIRMDWLRATRVEGQIAFDNKVVASDLGYFFSAAI